MPSAFRLVNHALAGEGSKNPKVSCSSISLQDLLLAKASSRAGNKTVLRERNLLKALNPKPFRSRFTLLKENSKETIPDFFSLTVSIAIACLLLFTFVGALSLMYYNPPALIISIVGTILCIKIISAYFFDVYKELERLNGSEK